MSPRPLVLLVASLGLGACATSYPLPPAEVVRYHLGEPIDRGTIRVEPLGAPGAPASLEFRTYAAAVEGELLRNGYTLAPAGTQPQLIATVGFARQNIQGPPRRSPFSIGLGGGGFSGGRRGGGVGLGGGVGFPVGGSGPRDLLDTELSVTIKRRADQSPVWEGRAHKVTDPRGTDVTADAQATALAAALFTGFPGQSGRSMTVR